MEIKIEHLSKTYGAQRAVDDISFHVQAGEIVGFLGPNGAGKTTTMKMITRYLSIGEGDIFIDGTSLKEEPDKLKQYIGYLPEHNPLYLDMPVIDYLEFCAALQGMEKDAMPKRIREMVGLCGLDAEKHKKIGELSKGYRQRVGLAQAMIHDPEILILDEPTTGLDPNQIVEIRKLIKEIGKQKTVILSTHILPEVEATCDRILIINKGKIVADGTAQHLRNQAQGQEVVSLTVEDGTSEEILKELKALATVAQVKKGEGSQDFEVFSKEGVSSRREVFSCCKDNGWIITRMVPTETKLEDIFRQLTMN